MSKRFSVSTKYSTAIPRSQRRKGVEGRGGAVAVDTTGGVTVAATRSYVDGNFVGLAGDQIVRGIKDFADGIKLFGRDIFRYDAETDTWELNGNLVVTGGAAFFTKLEGFEKLTITQAINCDERTIHINDAGQLEVIGGTGGGLDEDQLAEYLAENGYATQTWVTNQKYFTQANFTTANIKSTLGISDWALAATKPSYTFSEIESRPTTIAGYRITDAYTKTEVQENFLAIDGIAARAKILAGSLSAASYMLFSGNELNHCNNGATNNFWFGYRQPSGSARTTNKWLFSSSAETKLPDGDIQAGRLRLGSTDPNIPSPRYTLDVKGDASIEGTFYLNGAPMTYNSSKNAWQIDGNLIVTGGLAVYTKLSGFTDLDVMGGVVTDGTTIHINSAGQLEVIGGTSSGGSVSITGAASTIVSSNLTASRALISNSSGKVAVSAVTSTELGYLDGVTSAIQTQLNNKQATLVSGTNIKTINGASILGSGDLAISGGSSSGITIDDVEEYLSDNEYITRESTFGSGTTGVYINTYDFATGFTINRNRSGNYDSAIAFATYGTNTALLVVKWDKTFQFAPYISGSATNRFQIDSSGNVTASGTVTENSDRKLKNVEYEGDGLELEVLKKVKVAKWHWKDNKRDKRLHIGGIADNLAEVMPEVVFESEDDDGTKTSSIAYGKAGFSIAASLIAPVASHEDKIKELERNIEKMQKELDKLRKSA